jgi:3,4-dihydroxy 2-butanone 4-phosphate synthase/GTP cyclohydrolase II
MIPLEQFVENAEFYRRQYGLPLVTLSNAQSLDGSIAARRGERLKLSGEESKRMTHRLRTLHDAILVGIGTILPDDPQLTARLAPGKSPQPVILDSALHFTLDAQLLQRSMNLPWIAATDKADMDRQERLEQAGVRVFRFPGDALGFVPLTPLLQRLATEGINSIMVEGGARVIGSFLSAGLVNQVIITIAPRFVGGLAAVDFDESKPGTDLSVPDVRVMGVEKLGEDLVIWGKLPMRNQ